MYNSHTLNLNRRPQSNQRCSYHYFPESYRYPSCAMACLFLSMKWTRPDEERNHRIDPLLLPPHLRLNFALKLVVDHPSVTVLQFHSVH